MRPGGKTILGVPIQFTVQIQKKGQAHDFFKIVLFFKTFLNFTRIFFLWVSIKIRHIFAIWSRIK